mmetsp:Transcript_53371/g.106170  ORF Transcript_53371/g.106170 Transcript_53371/m.106170 type:complete len:116 (+) Transcript_53371:200-547(+)
MFRQMCMQMTGSPPDPPHSTSRVVRPQRQVRETVLPHGPQGPSWQGRWHSWLQPIRDLPQSWPQSGMGSEHFMRWPTQRTSIAAAASLWQRRVFPHAQRSPQADGSRSQSPQSPG